MFDTRVRMHVWVSRRLSGGVLVLARPRVLGWMRIPTRDEEVQYGVRPNSETLVARRGKEREKKRERKKKRPRHRHGQTVTRRERERRG